jgi:hypothetical protein
MSMGHTLYPTFLDLLHLYLHPVRYRTIDSGWIGYTHAQSVVHYPSSIPLR